MDFQSESVSSVLSSRQDIIVYCKFIIETLQYRWCTIQGVNTPPTVSCGPANIVTESGGETVTITEFSNGKGSVAFSQKSSGYDGTSEQRRAQSKSEWTDGHKHQKDQC